MKKRLLSLLAVLCLIAAMLPAPARAEDDTPPSAAGTVHETDGTDLKAVIQRAQSGDTVRLISDYTASVEYIAVINKDLTIDLNGYKLTFDTCAPNPTSHKIQSLGLLVRGSDVTLKNGTIQSTCAGSEVDLASTLYISAVVGSDGKLTSQVGRVTLDGVTVIGSNGVPKSGYAAILYGGTLTVDAGSSLTSKENATIYGYGEGANVVNISGTVTHTGTFSAVEGSYASTGTMTINVHDGAKINGGEGAGILQMAPGSVTVDGGSIEAATGIAMTKGTLTVSGGKIKGTGEYQEYKGSANYKVYDNGAAVYIEPVAAGTKVTISGGELSSDKSYALSAPGGGNTGDRLDIAVSGGTFIGSTKGAIDADGEEGIVSGGKFSSPVDPTLLSDDLKYEAKASGDGASYSYHKTKSEAQNAAGTGGKTTYLGEGEDPEPDTPPAEDPPSDDPPSDDPPAEDPPSDDPPSGDTPSTPSKPAALTGSVTIIGEPWVGETLTARVRNTNNTGTLYYQWTADGYYIGGGTSPYFVLTGYEVGRTVRCEVTSSVQTGSITGRYWETIDYYRNRYSPAESTTDTTSPGQSGGSEAENGFTLETPIFATATNTDGTKTTTVIQPDGSSALITLTSYGTVSSASVTFSSNASATAQRTGNALVLPTSVQPSRSAASAAPLRIVLPFSYGSVLVKIPVSPMTTGTVAVLENSFGPNTVVKSSVSASDGVLFALTGSAVVKVVDNTKSFQDVSDSAWYTNAVRWASSREVMTGVSAQRFDPQGTVNRAMMTQMLYNFDRATDKGVVSQFSDVSSRDWYAVSVSWATKNGIARSDGDRFGALDALEREDMAVMLYNYARLKGYNPYASGNLAAFSDSDNVSDWARTAMQWAVGAGLITGTQNGTKAVVLDPQGSVTRAQLATIMQRFNNLY